MADNIRVLIVDDISSTIDNLKKLLSFEDDIDVVGTATNGREAVETTKQLGPRGGRDHQATRARPRLDGREHA